MAKTKQQAIIGCLLGTAVGDALGLSSEGLSKSRLKKWYPDLNRYHFLGSKGMCSDDTEQTCMVAQTLSLAQGNIARFRQLLAWKLKFWLLRLPAGIGFATLRAILKLWLGFTPERSGVYSAGNGAAMRCALIGVYAGHDIQKLRQFVQAATRLTHTDPKAEWGAVAVALAADLASTHDNVAAEMYLGELQATLKDEPTAHELLRLVEKVTICLKIGYTTAEFAETLGLFQGVSGYVYHTVPVALYAWLRNQSDYATAVIEVIQCGGDTDTTAAIVGGIVGAQVGRAGIPTVWLDNLWEFPHTVTWMEQLGMKLSQSDTEKITFQPLNIIFILLRNLVFMLIVLMHGFRRLLPPY